MRGVIEHIARQQQINDFSGMAFGTITPTDIDLAIEKHKKAWIVCEVKYNGKELPFGQRLYLENLMWLVNEAKVQGVAFIVDHYIEDVNVPVPVAECIVRELYYSGERKWRKPKTEITARQLSESFLVYVGLT